MKPFFSIILPTYNRAHLIGETIQHILNQSFQNFELIVVDDASTDNTQDVLNSIKDERIVVLANEVNLERSASRNKGIQHAKAEWIAFCDSDDLWKGKHLQTLHETILKNDETVGLYFTEMTWNFADRKQSVSFPDIAICKNKVEYLIEHQIGTPCVCIHQSIFKDFQFNSEFRLNEDVDLYAKIATKYPIFQIKEQTVDVQIHDQNTKNTFRDHLQPQIDVFEHLSATAPTKNNISKSFARSRMANLKNQQISLMLNNGFPIQRMKIIHHLLNYPSFPGKKIKLVALIYSLPGGEIIKKAIRKWK